MTAQTSSSLKEGGDDGDPLPQVVVIYNAITELPHGESRDLVADQESAQTAEALAAGLRSIGYRAEVAALGAVAEMPSALGRYDPRRTLMFNLCEAPEGKTSEEPKVVQMLEAMRFRYTGATATALATCIDKARTKRILQAHGVPTAPFQVCRSPRATVRGVRLPAIVKPLAEDGSIGITRDSVVTSREALRRQISYVLDTYRQPALVEEFLPGREFNVAVWGNGTLHVLPLAELQFGDYPELERLCHYDAKWSEDTPEYAVIVPHCPAEVDAELAERLRSVALKSYQVMGLKDYGRVDMRVRDGMPYVLEVNPNPCLASDAGFWKAAQAAGYDYAHMVERIVRWAWEGPRRRTRVSNPARVRQPMLQQLRLAV